MKGRAGSRRRSRGQRGGVGRAGASGRAGVGEGGQTSHPAPPCAPQKYVELRSSSTGASSTSAVWAVRDGRVGHVQRLGARGGSAVGGLALPPPLRCGSYLYQDGYCRTSWRPSRWTAARAAGAARAPWAAHDAGQMVHLTNYCMQVREHACGAMGVGQRPMPTHTPPRLRRSTLRTWGSSRRATRSPSSSCRRTWTQPRARLRVRAVRRPALPLLVARFPSSRLPALLPAAGATSSRACASWCWTRCWPTATRWAPRGRAPRRGAAGACARPACHLSVRKDKRCMRRFELFGYDFLINEDLRVHLVGGQHKPAPRLQAPALDDGEGGGSLSISPPPRCRIPGTRAW